MRKWFLCRTSILLKILVRMRDLIVLIKPHDANEFSIIIKVLLNKHTQ